MANEPIASWTSNDLQKSTQLGYQSQFHATNVPNSNPGSRGAAFSKEASAAYTDVIRIPAGAVLTTGIRFDFLCVDDGKDSSDLGKVAVLGVQAKAIADNTDNLDFATGAGAEQTANVTLAPSSGLARVLTLSVPNAALDGAAAGTHVALKFRRVATNAADTLQGRLVVLRVSAYAY